MGLEVTFLVSVLAMRFQCEFATFSFTTWPNGLDIKLVAEGTRKPKFYLTTKSQTILFMVFSRDFSDDNIHLRSMPDYLNSTVTTCF